MAGILDELEPVISELVVTRNSSSRSMDPETLAELATEAFGPDRVRSAERLDDALEIAVGLADDAAGADGLGTSGVLVTGSVITAGRCAGAAHRVGPGCPGGGMKAAGMREQA